MSGTEIAFDEVAEVQRQIERHRETNWEHLDPEKRAFGSAFLACPLPAKAAAEVGLKPDHGRRLYKDPVVRAYIAYLQEMVEGTSIVNAQYLDAMLAHLIPIFAGEEEAPIVVPGVGIADLRKLHGPELLRCLDMVAKHNGYYNADLSQNSFLQMIQAMQDAGRAAVAQESPVDPAKLRLAYEQKEEG